MIVVGCDDLADIQLVAMNDSQTAAQATLHEILVCHSSCSSDGFGNSLLHIPLPFLATLYLIPLKINEWPLVA